MHFSSLNIYPLGKPKLEIEIAIINRMIEDLSSRSGFIECHDGFKNTDGSYTLGCSFTSGGALKVLKAVWDLGWVTYTDKTDVFDRQWGEMLEKDNSFIDDLPEDEAHELLSWMVRGNKWSDAFFGFHSNNGNVERLLQRLLNLKIHKAQLSDDYMNIEFAPLALREDLVRSALWWQKLFGVAPHITTAVSEFDAARLIGMPLHQYSEYMQNKTAVSKGCDIVFNKVRYQVKANRPSGKPSSTVTLVGKASNYEWDQLIWILYDSKFNPQEAWLWNVEAYKDAFDKKPRISPCDYRKGLKLDLTVLKK